MPVQPSPSVLSSSNTTENSEESRHRRPRANVVTKGLPQFQKKIGRMDELDMLLGELDIEPIDNKSPSKDTPKSPSQQKMIEEIQEYSIKGVKIYELVGSGNFGMYHRDTHD